MSILNHFPNFQLTQDQQTTLGQVEAFLESGDQIFLLKGYAGTGKTTLLHGICRYLAARQSDFRLMAPTGRAAMILARKTAIKSSTIHRGIYNMDQLKEKEEGTSFKFFYALKTNEDSSRCVYLVDEASMISDVYSDDEFFTFGSGLLWDCSKKCVKRFLLTSASKSELPTKGGNSLFDAEEPPLGGFLVKGRSI